MHQFLWTILSGILFLQSTSFAARIAIMDSGTDLTHRLLKDHAWVNPPDTLGENGYKDDIHGWNFADNNNELIDRSLFGKFSPEMVQFFEVQLRLMNGVASEEDFSWAKEKSKDEKFIEELESFSNFVHGTHVAGIAAADVPLAQIMVMRTIGGKKEESSPEANLKQRITMDFTSFGILDRLFKASGAESAIMYGALSLLASMKLSEFLPMSQYLANKKMQVVNCSFGSGPEQAEKIAQVVAALVLRKELTEEETAEYGNYFMTQLVNQGVAFPAGSPNTLFVVAAGNDGMDNDQISYFPTNIKAANLISVAATREFEKLASFSNYGASKVDIAAPGVGILSAIPGDGIMAFSGTSQATPFVSRVAGQVLDANPTLTPAQVKEILMKTVDKKDFLAGKVASGGIVNEQRAVQAAVFSQSMPLWTAVKLAQQNVPAISTPAHFRTRILEKGDATPTMQGVQPIWNDGYALPLPAAF